MAAKNLIEKDEETNTDIFESLKNMTNWDDPAISIQSCILGPT